MKQFIPREKLSKKSRKELERKKRQTWGPINPVTRKTENAKAYNRKKVQKGDFDYFHFEPFCIYRAQPTRKRENLYNIYCQRNINNLLKQR